MARPVVNPHRKIGQMIPSDHMAVVIPVPQLERVVPSDPSASGMPSRTTSAARCSCSWLIGEKTHEMATALIAKAVAISIEKGLACIKSGVDCIYIGDSFASGSVISPAVYRRFCVPAYAEAAQEFHRHGVFCYKHCCGNYNPLLDDFVSVGVDAMDGMDPTSGMSVRHTKEKIGDRVTLMGGLSCLTLLKGTPDQVYEEAKQCVLDGKPGGRYTLGSACAVPRHTPAENMMAARAAAVDFGTYV